MEVLEYFEVVGNIMSRRANLRKDLSCFESLLQLYDNPHLASFTIHVAGTNGKGQVSGKVAQALIEEGYKVGLFTSPHISEYRERIRVNGEKIPEERVIAYYQEFLKKSQVLDCPFNFFDCTTLFAFQYFRDANVDVAVMECGIGGALDSTNVVKPLVSVITSIAKDHTEFLGDTLEAIATQKAGVIKPNTPVVVGPRAFLPPLKEKADKCQAPLHLIEKRSCFYDTENQAVANAVLESVSETLPLSDSSIKKGLYFSLPCRFEKRGNVLYDVAHNPDGFARLIGALKHLYPYQKFRFVIGMGKEKDIKGCFKEVDKVADFVHFVQGDPERGADPHALAFIFQRVSSCPYSIELSVTEGVKNAKAALKPGQLFIVCGSFYIMHEAYR